MDSPRSRSQWLATSYKKNTPYFQFVPLWETGSSD